MVEPLTPQNRCFLILPNGLLGLPVPSLTQGTEASLSLLCPTKLEESRALHKEPPNRRERHGRHQMALSHHRAQPATSALWAYGLPP